LKVNTLLEKLKIYSDLPAEDTIMFGFHDFADHISDVILSQKIEGVIALDADWGMGKTTLLKMIEKKMKEENIKTVIFNSWHNEKIDIFSAFLNEIERVVSTDKIKKQVGKSLLSLGLDIFLRKFADMTTAEATEHFKKLQTHSIDLTDILKDLIGDDKLVIFIDDLDRCSTDNILEMLEKVKQFFVIPNIIVVMAINLGKIEKAWALRHSGQIGINEGREHVEKIFNLKFNINRKKKNDVREFLRDLTSFDGQFLDNILIFFPHNPRTIKRILSHLYFVLHYFYQDLDADDGLSPSEFREILGWISLCLNHPHIAKKVQYEPGYLTRASIICNKIKYYDIFKKFLKGYNNINEFKTKPTSGEMEYRIGNEKVRIARECISPKLFELLSSINDDVASFSIFKGMSIEFKNIINKDSFARMDNEFTNRIDMMIKKCGLMGAY